MQAWYRYRCSYSWRYRYRYITDADMDTAKDTDTPRDRHRYGCRYKYSYIDGNSKLWNDVRVYKHNTLHSFVLFFPQFPLPFHSPRTASLKPCWSCSEIEAKENAAATLLHHTQPREVLSRASQSLSLLLLFLLLSLLLLLLLSLQLTAFSLETLAKETH